MEIRDLLQDETMLEQTAHVLLAAFAGHATAWQSLDAARDTVRESLEAGRISRVAIEDGQVCGWIGGIPQYHGTAWELHPLCVAPAMQGRGIGRMLVCDLEHNVARMGGGTIYLSTDDADGSTSLFGTRLYPHVLDRVSTIQFTPHHPVGFYLHLGYTLTGVIPDAYGAGRHDLLLAKYVPVASE